jgi:predicted adenine nucleotide alpha hydrolase (AANH) superfamily ATPase
MEAFASVEACASSEAVKEKPALFWYNPNIHPYTEYQSRRESLSGFALEEELELIMEDEYGLRGFLSGLCFGKDNDDRGFKQEKRCHYCYRIRLERTACQAAEKGFHAFSTTLLTSPYQKHELIRQIGEECALQYGVEFFYRDFRPWYREGRKKARAKGSYMQKYCGCIFSEEERYLNNAL